MDDTYATIGQGYGQQVLKGSPAPMISGTSMQSGPMQSPVPGARYQSSFTNPETGGIVDRYIVPQRSTVPVRQVVPEVQNFNVTKQIMVPEVKEIQVPVQRLVPEEYTVMVPRVRTVMVPQQITEQVPEQRTRMVPQTFTQTQQIQTQKAVTVQQPMQRTIQKVIEGQKIIEAARVIEYERPRVIAGRYLGTAQTAPREVGLQWTKQYYAGASEAQVVGQQVTVAQSPVQYAQPVQTQVITQPVQTQYVQPAGYQTTTVQPAAYQATYVNTMPATYTSGPTYGNSAQTYGQTVTTFNKEADFEGYQYSTQDQAGTVI